MPVRDVGNDLLTAGQARKTVTIVFSDVVGSTELGEQLEPETLQHVMSLYGDEMRRVIELYGGRVEKFVGDAVMAVFGVPVLHEDDAIRAVRATLGMRDALTNLNRELEREYGVELRIRIGVNTGEVITDERAVEKGLVAADAVNTASRLQTAAPTGGVVIGPQTHGLVRGLVRMRRYGHLEVRGKSRRIRTWLVEGVVPGRDTVLRMSADDMVGRRRELRSLHHRFTRCGQSSRCVVTTVFGSAGIGKSRLAKKFIAEVEGSARVVVGRCLPYGEGITYWPLTEIVDELGGVIGLRALMSHGEEDLLAAAMVASAVGRSQATASAQDVQWAFGRLLQILARSQPVVVVLDDVHWAEPPLFDLIEYLAGYVTAAPVMILCLARKDLLERRPGWASGRGAAISLRPLSATDSLRLVRRRARRRSGTLQVDEILAAAQGNPLYIEHLVAMQVDDPVSAAPPGIQALLAARVDVLPPDCRRVIETAAVEGRSFHAGAVRELVSGSGDIDVEAALEELGLRELIRADQSAFAEDRGYRFTHNLVRDAAYELLPKRRRAELHVAFASWLQAQGSGRRDLDEIIGYHLEQAYRYRQQLGRVDAGRHRALADDAASHLTAAGRRLLAVGDRPAAAGLLERAAALLPADDAGRAAVLIDLGGVLREEGQFAAAEGALGEAISLAAARSDDGLESRARVELLLARLQVDPDGVARLATWHGKRLQRSMQAGKDQAGLARLWHLRALLAWVRAHAGEAEGHWRRAAAEARLARDDRMLADVLGWEGAALVYGPTPVDEAFPRCLDIVEQLRENPWAAALAQHQVAGLFGMRGAFDRAFALLDEANSRLAQFAPTVDAAVSHPEVLISMLAGDAARAERHLRAGRRTLRAMGERALLSSTEALLGMAVLAQGRAAEADRLARRSARLTTDDDTSAQVLWRRVRAVVLAGEGRLPAAERLAYEAVELASGTDYLNEHAGALDDLGRILQMTGRLHAADSAREHALALYRRKGNIAAAVQLTETAPRRLHSCLPTDG